MQRIAQQPIVIGSHQFLDRLSLALHYAVASRLLLNPELVLNRANENLDRWMASQSSESGEAQSLIEWRDLITQTSSENLIRIITEDSEEGQRLRQSSPFVGILSPQEREELITLCEQGSIA